MRTIVISLVCAVALGAYAQEEFHRFNFNVGGGVGIPIKNTSDVANVNGNAVIGGGINFRRAFGFTGEFMWHGLPPSDTVLRLLAAPNASANLYSVTGNFIGRYGANKRIGAYVIGGGGWYHRNWEITAPVLVPGTVCGPSFFWYGLVCVNGLVPANAVLHSGQLMEAVLISAAGSRLEERDRGSNSTRRYGTTMPTSRTSTWTCCR